MSNDNQKMKVLNWIEFFWNKIKRICVNTTIKKCKFNAYKNEFKIFISYEILNKVIIIIIIIIYKSLMYIKMINYLKIFVLGRGIPMKCF